MAKISKVEASLPTVPVRKRVAAYARVSMETDRLAHSLAAQISYYSELIQNNPEWEYAGIYSDSFVSGTSIKKRTEFRQMIDDCDAGKIDIILCKSISRFARNTVDLLNTVRHLKELGIEVRFEKEGINSLSGDGELMLSILASFAQEESRSISENLKWGIRKRMSEGVPDCHFRIYGYRWEGDNLVVVPEEAAVVKRIFQDFLDGKSRTQTVNELNADGITTRSGKRWCDSSVRVILTNVTYTGNMLLQKEYTTDSVEKKKIKNHGELPQYWIENTHPALIDLETFNSVQAEIARRKSIGPAAYGTKSRYFLTGKIKCPYCHCNYTYTNKKIRSTSGRYYAAWQCAKRATKLANCREHGTINHDSLIRACNDVLGIDEFDEDAFSEKIDVILVPEKHYLEFHMKDGTVTTRYCPAGHYSTFTGMIRCSCCGNNYIKRKTLHSDGTETVFWLCGQCRHKPRLREDDLKRAAAEVLGISEFDEGIFKSKIKCIEAGFDPCVTFRFKDGKTKEVMINA